MHGFTITAEEAFENEMLAAEGKGQEAHHAKIEAEAFDAIEAIEALVQERENPVVIAAAIEAAFEVCSRAGGDAWDRIADLESEFC